MANDRIDDSGAGYISTTKCLNMLIYSHSTMQFSRCRIGHIRRNLMSSLENESLTVNFLLTTSG